MEYGPEAYGDHWADIYDAWPNLPGSGEQAAEFLAALAGGGRALELGIGTGRVALPLARRGVEVHGIGASEAMVEKLREKPGGAAIPASIGDFADVEVESRFSLVYVVVNTFFALLTQEDQIRCFRNVAKRLKEDGVFVIEAFAPDMSRYVGGQAAQAKSVEPGRVILEASRHDPVEQKVRSRNIAFSEGGTSLYPVGIRYAWPSELDLTARLAGLALRNRFGGWSRDPFTAQSGAHLSVCGKS